MDDSKFEVIPRPHGRGGLWLTNELVEAVHETLSTTKALRLKPKDVGGRSRISVGQTLRIVFKDIGKVYTRSDGDDIIVWLEDLTKEK